MIKAVIFDMDGVIVDTEPLYKRFWIEASAACGYTMSEELELSIRSLAGKYAEPMLKKEISPDFDYNAVKNIRRQLMAEYIDKHGINRKPGVEELLQYLNGRHILTAIATATPMDRVIPYLDAVSLTGRFGKIVCAYAVENGKPAPDVYLEAAKQLDLSPSECIAVEDSPNGVMSAYSAGCKTIMVPDLTPVTDDLRSMLFAEAKSLNDIIDIIGSTHITQRT